MYRANGSERALQTKLWADPVPRLWRLHENLYTTTLKKSSSRSLRSPTTTRRS